MRYPIISTKDASSYLASKRAGTPIELERLVRMRGDGPEMDYTPISDLRADLDILMRQFGTDGMKSMTKANQFEADAATAIHRRLSLPVDVLADPDFWLWLSVTHCSDVVEWRYGNTAGGTGLPNYGIGARNENLLYRLWLRADLVLDDEADDRYHLCKRGQIDFYRSHLFRQGYANARNFARALLRFQYPHEEATTPRLKVDEIRTLVKRLRRLRTNLFVEILGEQECRSVIEDELNRMPTAA